jgi:hypothetical protein
MTCGKTMISMTSDTTRFSILNINDKIGSTGYIDRIELTDLTSNPMIGMDKYKRPFIVFAFKCTGNKNVDKEEIIVETFFQRYVDDSRLWMGAGDILLCTVGGMEDEQAQFLKEFVQTKEVTLNAEQIKKYGVSTTLLDYLDLTDKNEWCVDETATLTIKAVEI